MYHVQQQHDYNMYDYNMYMLQQYVHVHVVVVCCCHVVYIKHVLHSRVGVGRWVKVCSFRSCKRRSGPRLEAYFVKVALGAWADPYFVKVAKIRGKFS